MRRSRGLQTRNARVSGEAEAASPSCRPQLPMPSLRGCPPCQGWQT